MLRLINAMWLRALLAPWYDLAGAVFFSEVGFGGGFDRHEVARKTMDSRACFVSFPFEGVLRVVWWFQWLRLYPSRMFVLVCVHVLVSCSYEYK